MKKFIKILGLVCLLAAVLLSGCGGKSEPQSADEPKQVETPAPAGSAEGEAAALFAKGKKIDAMSFEYVITSPNESVEGKAWVKGNMCKNEMMFEGQTVIHIFDLATGDTYVYIPEENMATLTNISPEEAGWAENPSDYYDDIDETTSVKIVGTETVAGYKCKVMTLTNAEGKLETKMWVAEENGVPLRIESYEEQGTSIIEYKNLKIGSVSDDEFKLPENVTIMDLRTPKQ